VFIKRAGGSVGGKISIGPVPAGLTPAYVHRQSRTLSEILRELLHASNNYIANQIFLEIGAHRLGGPVSLEKSVEVAHKVLAAYDLADAIQLEEGSGLSRGNRFTARGLAKMLNLFAPHVSLLESRNLVQDRHARGRPHACGLYQHIYARAGALRDFAQGQQWLDALRAAQGYRVGALV
jgi:D-alanyl-D-alanine carboxypeptidase/D-alanyl-D-alanine-endopeptidase (penicillin-binding protein 4)